MKRRKNIFDKLLEIKMKGTEGLGYYKEGIFYYMFIKRFNKFKKR